MHEAALTPLDFEIGHEHHAHHHLHHHTILATACLSVHVCVLGRLVPDKTRKQEDATLPRGPLASAADRKTPKHRASRRSSLMVRLKGRAICGEGRHPLRCLCGLSCFIPLPFARGEASSVTIQCK